MDKPYSVDYSNQLCTVFSDVTGFDFMTASKSAATILCNELNNAYRLGREFERRKVEQTREEKEN